jgi:hypothetical protein
MKVSIMDLSEKLIRDKEDLPVVFVSKNNVIVVENIDFDLLFEKIKFHDCVIFDKDLNIEENNCFATFKNKLETTPLCVEHFISF